MWEFFNFFTAIPGRANLKTGKIFQILSVGGGGQIITGQILTGRNFHRANNHQVFFLIAVSHYSSFSEFIMMTLAFVIVAL